MTKPIDDLNQRTKMLLMGQDKAGEYCPFCIVLDLPDVPHERTDFRMVTMAQDPALPRVSLEVDPFKNHALLA